MPLVKWLAGFQGKRARFARFTGRAHMTCEGAETSIFLEFKIGSVRLIWFLSLRFTTLSFYAKNKGLFIDLSEQ